MPENTCIASGKKGVNGPTMEHLRHSCRSASSISTFASESSNRPSNTKSGCEITCPPIHTDRVCHPCSTFPGELLFPESFFLFSFPYSVRCPRRTSEPSGFMGSIFFPTGHPLCLRHAAEARTDTVLAQLRQHRETYKTGRTRKKVRVMSPCAATEGCGGLAVLQRRR